MKGNLNNLIDYLLSCNNSKITAKGGITPSTQANLTKRTTSTMTITETNNRGEEGGGAIMHSVLIPRNRWRRTSAWQLMNWRCFLAADTVGLLSSVQYV